MKKADARLLDEIEAHGTKFVQVVKANSERRGIKWDDLILLFEWSFELDECKTLC